jgi:signal transduction histidine kinase
VTVRRRVESRRVVLGAAAALAAAVFALRLAVGSTADAVGLLYVLPVMLVALELGLVAGVAAAAVAVALVVLGVVLADASLTGLGLATRATAVFSVGAVAGRFSDRMRRAQRRHQGLLESGLDLARLDESERLGRALAAHARAIVGASGARVVVDGSPAAEDGTLGEHVLAVPVEGRDGRVGTLEVSCAGARPDEEDETVLALLALQGGVAADNQRLMAGERARAVLEAELVAARRRLEEQGEGLTALLGRDEDERRDVAEQLREQCAQTLAAVLLGLSALRRGVDSEALDPTFAELRAQVDGTLREVRDLAERLRPPVLDQLGLVPALERLVRDAPHDVEMDAGGMAQRLPPAVETVVYRTAETVVRRAPAAARLRLEDLAGGCRLEATLEPGADEDHWKVDLESLRARLAVVHGTLEVEPAPAGSRLVAWIPLAASTAPPAPV